MEGGFERRGGGFWIDGRWAGSFYSSLFMSLAFGSGWVELADSHLCYR